MLNKDKRLSASRLRECLNYDSETGVFTWRISTSRRSPIGSVAGAKHICGYKQIQIDRENLLAHRLAWLYVHGEWPKSDIDHINGDRSDNRIANLRDVPKAINNQNIRRPMSTNSSGLLGVSWSKKDQTWRAQISVSNRTLYIGSHKSADLANQAYLSAKRRLHAGCTI